MMLGLVDTLGTAVKRKASVTHMLFHIGARYMTVSLTLYSATSAKGAG